jgi:hypothetical protein
VTFAAPDAAEDPAENRREPAFRGFEVDDRWLRRPTFAARTSSAAGCIGSDIERARMRSPVAENAATGLGGSGRTSGGLGLPATLPALGIRLDT